MAETRRAEAPKYIRAKAEELDRALARVARLAEELEEWYAKKTDEYEATMFFIDEKLDQPYEFDLQSVLAALDEVAS